MRKIINYILILSVVIALSTFILVGCDNKDSEFGFDLPDLTGEGWYETLNTDFRNIDTLDGTVWSPSPHGLRNYEYWCDDMLEFTDEGIVVKSLKTDEHECSSGVCPKKGVFTSGIETRTLANFHKDENGNFVGDNELLFSQAYGYYEATVKVPRGSGMWSAFWLQSLDIGKIGHGGKDGAEIDIYESSFGQYNPSKTGACIHIDAYSAPFYRSKGAVKDVGYNLYDGEFHTYALKWTPDYYIVFVDGNETFRSNYGGVSTTPEFLRLTVEIRDNGWGPYGQKIDKFKNYDDNTNDFVIQEVKVYQNSSYEPYIKAPEDYKNMRNLYLNLIITFSVFGGLAAILAGFAITRYCLKKKHNFDSDTPVDVCAGNN